MLDVIGSLWVSLGSSTVQLDESLGSRRACTCSEAGFSSQISDCARGLYYRRGGRKKYFLFMAGIVRRVKGFTTGSRSVAKVSLMTKTLKRRCGSCLDNS
jgi:hypothetical protein